MSYIETKDPFGFVGSHVIRKQLWNGEDEHGWLTRYNETLDCYTLFVPGGGEPRLLARGEVMKFLSAPNIEFYDDDQDEWPPPVKDTTTSRYLGVKIRLARKGSSCSEPHGSDQDIQGHVKCYFPFTDRYSVEYEDGFTDEVSESTVICGMITLIKSQCLSSSSQTKERYERARIWKRESSRDDDKVQSVRRKRQRVENTSSCGNVQEIPSGSVAVVEDVSAEQQDDDVVFADQVEMRTSVISKETETVPNILDSTSTASGSSTREKELEMASCSLNMSVVSDDATGQDDMVESQERQKELSRRKELVKDRMPANASQCATQQVVPFYIVDTKPHVAIEPLPRRAMAFNLLRASLLSLLDRPEASSVKNALQYNLLRNSDVRDRDAVIRFMDAGGLLVLNHLLNLFASEGLDDKGSKVDSGDRLSEKLRGRMKRDDELLYVLKLVAMLPTPSRNQVIASKVGKTINYLSKTHGPPGRQSALPQCVTALAKWIKTSWIKNIPSAPKSPPKKSGHTRQLLYRPQQQARRGGRGGSYRRPNLQLNRRQPPPSQQPQHQVSSVFKTPVEQHALQDNTPIPRLSRPEQTAKPQESIAACTASQLPVSRRVQGSLKPDWMRQKEKRSRSRIDDSTNVDTRLCRDTRVHSITNVTGPLSQAPKQQDQNLDQHEDAGGPDGVCGRAQKLRFGKRWSVQEFGITDPPGTLKQSAVSSCLVRSYDRTQYSDQHSVHVPPVPYSSRQPQPILRRVSRYNDEPVIDSPGK